MGRIVIDLSDGVATATISAPPMNALSFAMRAELAEQLPRLSAGACNARRVQCNMTNVRIAAAQDADEQTALG